MNRSRSPGAARPGLAGRRRTAACVALALLALLACQQSPERRAYVEELMRRRSEKDQFMRSESGPLTPEQRGRFQGLAYYRPNFDFVFEVPLEAAAVADTVRLLTSQRGVDACVRLGLLRFEHAGRTHALTLFRSLDGMNLFLPFTDRTSGDETYGAGRYLDPEVLPDGRYRLDFNLAYNPYCAYNARWVCPLPPAENQLHIHVQAGERRFPYEES